jgi:AraC-like DNA-binding protein
VISVQKYQPRSLLLQSLIEYYQWIETDEPLRLMTIPNGRVDAWVTLSGGFEFLAAGLPAPGAGFFPLSATNWQLRVPLQLTTLNIKFLPHVLCFPALHQLPAAASAVCFEDVFGKEEVSSFMARFSHVGGAEQAVDLAERFFEDHFFGPLKTDDWLAALLRHTDKDDSGTLNVQQLAAAVHVSVKTLERRFQKAMGIGPKIFLKIIRFQKAIREVQRGGGTGSLSLSLAGGYFDQSHFIKDSRSLTGLAPGKLLLRFAPQTSDVVVMDEPDT